MLRMVVELFYTANYFNTERFVQVYNISVFSVRNHTTLVIGRLAVSQFFILQSFIFILLFN